MRLRRPVLIFAATLLVASILVVCFAPLLVAGGLRWWAQRAANREGLRLELGEIEAPFLHPAIIRNLRLARPIYRPTAAYGHFGRDDIDAPWELTDKAALLRDEALVRA